MVSTYWHKVILCLGTGLIGVFFSSVQALGFDASAIAQQYMQQNGINNTPESPPTLDPCSACAMECSRTQPGNPFCLRQQCSQICLTSQSSPTTMPPNMSPFMGPSSMMPQTTPPVPSPTPSSLTPPPTPPEVCGDCMKNCQAFPDPHLCVNELCGDACKATPTINPQCQQCQTTCQQQFPQDAQQCISTMCQGMCTSAPSTNSLPTTAPTVAPPPPPPTPPTPTDCPDGWSNKVGRCYSPQGNSRCEGVILPTMTQDQKKGMAIWCGVDWPGIGVNHMPDLFYSGPRGESDVVSSGGFGTSCDSANFNDQAKWQDLNQITSWANNCKVNWKGVNYAQGQTGPFSSNKTCPDGWTLSEKNTCVNSSRIPNRCDLKAKFDGYSDEQKLQWAISCGAPWAAVGFPQSCPDGWIRDVIGGFCHREGTSCSPANFKHYGSPDQLKQWSQQCGVKWAGITYPYP